MTTPTPGRRPRNAGKRTEIEQWLNQHGVTFEYKPAVKIAEFDVESSLRNQARVYTQLDESVVESYADALKRGDQFPAVVAAKSSARGKLILVDGNHRLQAHIRAGDVPVDTYLITKAAKSLIVTMTFEANARHGLPSSHDERLFHATWLVDQGMSQEASAAAVNVKVADLRKAMSKINADRRADEVGISRREWESITTTGRSRLNAVSTDEGFAALARLAYRARLDSTEIADLVTHINTSRSGNKQTAMVKALEPQFSDRIQENAAGGVALRGRQRGPKQTFHLALGTLAALPDDLRSLASTFAEGEREEAAKRARDGGNRLIDLADKLEARA